MTLSTSNFARRANCNGVLFYQSQPRLLVSKNRKKTREDLGEERREGSFSSIPRLSPHSLFLSLSRFFFRRSQRNYRDPRTSQSTPLQRNNNLKLVCTFETGDFKRISKFRSLRAVNEYDYKEPILVYFPDYKYHLIFTGF